MNERQRACSKLNRMTIKPIVYKLDRLFSPEISQWSRGFQMIVERALLHTIITYCYKQYILASYRV